MKTKIEQMKQEMLIELTDNILPFWMNNMINKDNGLFYGEIKGDGTLVKEAPIGAIMVSRILWTFSSAYRLFGVDEYLKMADRAKSMLIKNFYDEQYGGIYWSVDCDGNSLDTKKQIYAIGFAIYGLSEYYRATDDKESLQYAIKLYQDIEAHSYDNQGGGYYEAFSRDWNELDDMRLSGKDANDPKTMNTHLHILEPYTNLYRVWKDNTLEKKLRKLIDIFQTKIINSKTDHLNLFFDEDWNSTHHIVSFGHDIECSWLLYEAALVIGDKLLIDTIKLNSIGIANAAQEGYQWGAGMMYEVDVDNQVIDAERHWWVQAETVVGFMNAYQYFDDSICLNTAIDCWNFIKKYIIDKKDGDWFWSIYANGKVNRDDDKAGFWKCPYHNGRMCMEIIERF